MKLIETLKQYRFDGQKYHHVFAKEAKRKGQCRVRNCRRPARIQVRSKHAGKGFRTVNHSTCITCEVRLYRANNPAREAYRQVKERARQRKQIFDITFEQFCAIPRFDEYIARRGRGIDELHLDRVKVERGYVPGNLQVLTTEENLRKQREVDYAPTEAVCPF